METAGFGQLLFVTPKQMQAVREDAGLDGVNVINERIDNIVEWYQKQPHLPKVTLDRRFVERVLIRSKGSVERTKQGIDNLYKVRGQLPEYFSYMDILHSKNKFIPTLMHYAPLPKLSEDNARVSFCKPVCDPDQMDLVTMFRYCFMIGELRLYHDCFTGEHIIIDLENVTMGHLKRLYPTILKNADTVCHEGYALRIKGIHLYNAPPIVEKIVTILKSVLRPKLASRIHVHVTESDLHKVITAEILPKEYGGEEKSLKSLMESWLIELAKEPTRKFLNYSTSLRSDETQRLGDSNNTEAELPGTFRKLQVD